MRSVTTRGLSRALGGAALATSVLTAALSGYLAAVSIAGVRRPRPRPRRAPTTRFAILVPAHDEAGGIAETLSSFDRLDYPSDLFEVHVVADNCTDGTAEVVRRCGHRVHERSDLDRPGKGPALNWLFDRIETADGLFDAVAVVDADTTVGPGFLRAMDAALAGGAEVAQGYYTVREPDASPATSFRYAALACRHHLRALGRHRIGASCGLYGNGMVFRRPVLAGRRWSGHLVEDAELQNELLLDGIRVVYVPDAVVEAEMPESAEAATSQNRRWERGRIEMARRYTPRLARNAVSRRSNPVPEIDAVLDHLVPPLSVLVAFELASAGVASAAMAARRPTARRALATDLLALAVVAAHAVVGLWSVRASTTHYRALLAAPRIAAWKVRLWSGVAVRGDAVAWTRTRRNTESAAEAMP